LLYDTLCSNIVLSAYIPCHSKHSFKPEVSHWAKFSAKCKEKVGELLFGDSKFNIMYTFKEQCYVDLNVENMESMKVQFYICFKTHQSFQ
jgi:hypothetical protein